MSKHLSAILTSDTEAATNGAFSTVFKPHPMQILKLFLKRVFLPLIALLVVLYIANAALSYFVAQEAARRGLKHQAENGMKHTYAACMLQELLRNLNFSREHTRNIVNGLGTLNEYVERLIKVPRDSTLEMQKDLENNLIGIEMGEWLEGQPLLRPKNRLRLIGLLAEQGVLIEDPLENCGRSPECRALADASNPSKAILWMEQNQGRLSRQAKAGFESIRVRAHTEP